MPDPAHRGRSMQPLYAAFERPTSIAVLPIIVIALSVAAAPGGPGPAVLENCAGCHHVEAGFSHPVDMVPSTPVPSHLPLSGGRMTCTTCHDASVAAHADARRLHHPLLRSSPEDGLCVACHSTRTTDRRDMHASSLDAAHLRWPFEPGVSNAAIGSSAVLDPQSIDCLSCHDGSVARDVAGGGSWKLSHPVGVPYRVDGIMSADAALRAPGSLDPRVRLIDGRVGCGSCHSPYSRHEALLVMSNTGSRLCLACHAF